MCIRDRIASIAEKVAGKPVPVAITVADASMQPAKAPSAPSAAGPAPSAPASGDIKAEALADSTVQAVLEIFPVEKTTVEER